MSATFCESAWPVEQAPLRTNFPVPRTEHRLKGELLQDTTFGEPVKALNFQGGEEIEISKEAGSRTEHSPKNLSTAAELCFYGNF
jgi:hypothetical protein